MSKMYVTAVVPDSRDDGTSRNVLTIGIAPRTPLSLLLASSFAAAATTSIWVRTVRPFASRCTTATRASAGKAKSCSACFCATMAGSSGETTAANSAVRFADVLGRCIVASTHATMHIGMSSHHRATTTCA